MDDLDADELALLNVMQRRGEAPVLLDGAMLQQQTLDTLALDLVKSPPLGSSAGGEQPKFIAARTDGTPRLVKFTPSRGSPFGERWHDMLPAEYLASQVLAEHGVPVAKTSTVESTARTDLLSDRARRRLTQLRSPVHVAFPDADETIKRGMPERPQQDLVQALGVRCCGRGWGRIHRLILIQLHGAGAAGY